MATHVREGHSVDIVAVVLRQHQQIRDLCRAVTAANPSARARPFDDVRARLTAHEAAEQAVVRPSTLETAGESKVGDREAEERAIKEELLDIGQLPPGTEEFGIKFSHLADVIGHHFEAEEREELPYLLTRYTSAERERLGRSFLRATRWAPTDPASIFAAPRATHSLLGPVSALLHRRRDD
ncbi:MAG: hemerythrin domain-containing protein [Bacillota bacterium]